MEIIKKIDKCKSTASCLRKKGYKIGFVPTMGSLHQGHLSLIGMAKKDCDKVFMSVFVNPTQFGPDEDYNNYPRNIERDSVLAERKGVDYIFYPEASDMYAPGYKTFVEVKELGKIMCGKHRPGHFKGVTTVVIKLFNIVKAHKAYFGQKDYQQIIIIKKMVEDLNLDIEIITGPTIREKDGLAISSRNEYLSGEERENAVILYESLNETRDMIESGRKDLEGIRREALKRIKKNVYVKSVDYFEFRDPATLKKIVKTGRKQESVLAAAAIWIGKTRLIDNMIIRTRKQ